MASDLIIRKLKIWEIPVLLRFRAQNDYKAPSDRDGYPESLLYSILKVFWHGERMVTIVAERENQIVGYISLIFGKGLKFKGNVYIVSAAVEGSFRGSGIGSQLFSFAEQHAHLRGAHRLELEVFARNDGAIRLYERLGYVTEGVKHRAVQSGSDYDDLVFMAKLLN